MSEGTADAAGALVEVHLLRLPVDLYQRAAEHSDELLREFALMQELHDDGGAVPAQLVTLIEEFRRRFAMFSAGPRTELEEAMAAGAREIDLYYRIPPEARSAVVELGTLLDEADEFCRAGTELLTLATPPEALAFRRWFLSEFEAQIDGRAPTPWSPLAAEAPETPDNRGSH